MDNPFFSVIIPVYNVEKYLADCMECISHQTFTDFEVILVNDGSTDSSIDIAEKYAIKNNWIHIHNQENQGLYMARRNGLKLAKGQYVVHIDSDDMCLTTLLSTLYKCIIKEMPDLIIYNYDLIDENNNNYSSHLGTFRDNQVLSKQDVIVKLLSGVDVNNIWIKCVKRSIISGAEEFDSVGRLMMGEDIVHTLAFLDSTEKIVYLDSHLYLYRVSQDGMSRTVKTSYINDYMKVRTLLYTHLWDELNDSEKTLFVNQYFRNLSSYLRKLSLTVDTNIYQELKESIQAYDIHSIMRKEFKRVSPMNMIRYCACTPFLAKVYKRIRLERT